MKKIYVLDTNILLDSPNAIWGFDDNDVVITGTTLQELDSKKTLGGDIGYNAREACRILESMRQKGNLLLGVPTQNSGQFWITAETEENLPAGYSLERPDNRIISAVKLLQSKYPHSRVILVTNDVSMRINASVCGCEYVEFYKNTHLSSEKAYTGREDIYVSDDVVGSIYEKNFLTDSDLDLSHLYENQFVTLKGAGSSALCIYQKNRLKLIDTKRISAFSVTPKNAAQTFALYALLAPVEEIPFVILKGPAGTAKTFLSLAAGLEMVYDSEENRSYDKVLISRNNVTADADFGYLPGDLDDKMTPLLAPFFDNLESLLRGKSKKEDSKQIQIQVEDMLYTKVIDICPLSYMRGRSITNSYLIVDETQNATRSQIRDIITRAGANTKVVICGDPEQIDTHALDKWNNGLVFASDKMKGSRYCAQVTFYDNESVRSELAKEAIARLNL